MTSRHLHERRRLTLPLIVCIATRSGIPPRSVCEAADIDGDHDVDGDDFGRFQRCYSGPGQPADPECAS